MLNKHDLNGGGSWMVPKKTYALLLNLFKFELGHRLFEQLDGLDWGGVAVQSGLDL